MSHFCVLVFCKDKKDVESILAPYQEYDGSYDFPRELLVFKEDEECDIDPDMNKRGYWENPQAFWDWYIEGGRYKNCFKLKNGISATSGKISDFSFITPPERVQEYSREWDIAVEGAERTEEEKHLFLYSKGYYLDQWENKEAFMDEVCNSWGFAFITPDGKMHKKRKSLMFGCSTATKEKRKKYVEEWNQTIKTLPPDTYMVVVDCHI